MYGLRGIEFRLWKKKLVAGFSFLHNSCGLMYL